MSIIGIAIKKTLAFPATNACKNLQKINKNGQNNFEKHALFLSYVDDPEGVKKDCKIGLMHKNFKSTTYFIRKTLLNSYQPTSA